MWTIDPSKNQEVDHAHWVNATRACKNLVPYIEKSTASTQKARLPAYYRGIRRDYGKMEGLEEVQEYPDKENQPDRSSC